MRVTRSAALHLGFERKCRGCHFSLAIGSDFDHSPLCRKGARLLLTDSPETAQGPKVPILMAKQTKLSPANVALSQTLAGVSPAAALANATADIETTSVSKAIDSNSAVLEMLAAIKASQDASNAKMHQELEQLRAMKSAPKTRTVRVTATGEEVISSGKRGKPPTAGFDDCRLPDGKVRKVGVRAYLSECSGNRVGTYVFASRGAIGSGKGETISKTAACPYDDAQVAMINAASAQVSEVFGLRFKLEKVTDVAFKLVPARTLTEVQAARVAPLLATVNLDADAWCVLRTTPDGTGDGEINAAPESETEVDATDLDG